MKFSRLNGKTDKDTDDHTTGHPVHCAESIELESKLSEKILLYQTQLEETQDPQARARLLVRLKVVTAQLSKSINSVREKGALDTLLS